MMSSGKTVKLVLHPNDRGPVHIMASYVLSKIMTKSIASSIARLFMLLPPLDVVCPQAWCASTANADSLGSACNGLRLIGTQI